jgi:uncharacterized phage protein gp47/JayE
MIRERSLQEIEATYFSALAASGSNLTVDQVEGSLAYTLFRGSAAVAIAQDNRLLDIQNQLSILDAVGDQLDTMAGFITAREVAQRATGNVLAVAKEESTVIPVGTVLSSPISGVQFKVITTPVTAITLFETRLTVESLEPGAKGNLLAGTQLYSSRYPSVCFRVGSVHTDRYYGDLVGGQDKESDEQYRARVIQTLTGSTVSSKNNLLNKLRQYPLVDRAFVKTRAAGIVEIWLDSASLYTGAQKKEVLEYIEPYLAAGAIPMLVQASRKKIDVTVDIKPFSYTSDLSSLTAQIKSSINNLLFSLDIGVGITVNAILQSFSTLVRESRVLSPVADITCGPDEILAPGDITFIISSSIA